jgi:hypothetical protein
MQGATLKGRWEDVKGGNSGPVELALARRRGLTDSYFPLTAWKATSGTVSTCETTGVSLVCRFELPWRALSDGPAF